MTLTSLLNRYLDTYFDSTYGHQKLLSCLTRLIFDRDCTPELFEGS